MNPAIAGRASPVVALQRATRLALGCGLATLLGGCTVGPDFVRPAPPAAERFTPEAPVAATVEADGVAQRFVPAAELPAEWWRLFESAPLDAAVAHALANSPTLQAAEASLRVAQDNLRAGDGVFYPHLDGGIGSQRARRTPQQAGAGASGAVFNLLTLNADIAYPVDVFGGERRAVEGLGARVDDQRFARLAAYLTLSANVVNTCIARAAYAAEVRATEQLIALESEQLHSIEIQVRAGNSAYSSVLVQRSLIAANRAVLAALQQRASHADHLLALLQGETPQRSALPDIDLASLTLPQALPLSVPSELVRRRPDILSAEAQLHVASADIGVATAALYPSFSLNASYGVAGSSLANLFAAGGRFWSIAPSLTAPLFHGGSLRAQRQAAVDAFDLAQANYRQAVLAAFAQVADCLRALEYDALALQAQSDSEDAAREALALLQANYRAGLVAYVDVLAADVLFHAASIARVQAAALRYQDTVALFAALGGGWWNAAGAGGRAP